MTTKQHLKNIPLQKRLQAIENIRREGTRFDTFTEVLNKNNVSPFFCIGGLFIWINTRQGHEYWSNINRKYFNQ